MIHRSLNLIDALRLARQLGAIVGHKRNKSEIVVRHPRRAEGVTVDEKRKDSPRHLIVFLRRLERERSAATAG